MVKKPRRQTVWTRWAVIGSCGLYVGQWETRAAAIKQHCEDKGVSWEKCFDAGDRVVKVYVATVRAHMSRMLQP